MRLAIFILLLGCLGSFGQAFTLQDTAFLGNSIPKSSGAWSPTNAYGWWHADSMTAADGSLVVTWPDSAGAHNLNVFSNSSTRAPYFTNNAVNSLPAVWWPLAAQTTSLALTNAFGSHLAQPWTLVTVIKTENPGIDNHYGTLFDGIDSTYRILSRQVGVSPFSLSLYAGTEVSGPYNLYGIPTFVVVTLCANTTSSYTRTNGIMNTQGMNIGANDWAGMTLGCNYSASINNSWVGGIAEVIIYNSQLATNDMIWVETNLMNKYGL